MATTTTVAPRVYVACLAAYNAGKLHGEWIDCDDSDCVREAIQEMLKASPEPGAEEYAIHDHEGFGGFSVGEWHDLDELCALAKAIGEHGEIVAKYVDNMGYNVAEGVEKFPEAYRGCWKDVEEYAYEFMNDLHEIPDYLESYVDYAKFGNDLELGGDIFTIEDGGCHVFANNI